MIHLELIAEDGTTFHNGTDSAGHFHLPEFEEGRNLSAIVYASNTRGRSEAKIMHLQMLTPLSASGDFLSDLYQLLSKELCFVPADEF